jgi:eukaryotic-like serine/threonine-protein kinase
MARGGPMQGAVISNRYELEDRLGSGGMSSVYRATDRVLERTVAVKVLAEHLSDDEKFVARFRREALAVAKLIHPNIVQVYDTGVDEGRHYIVMEYVEGRSGAQLLQRRGRLDPQTAAQIGVQGCAGLEYAHRQGIIHRDVKPGNLMVIGGPAVASDGGGGGEMTVKLTDFGIARAAEQTRLTQVGSVVGTAAYLAPEQTRGEEATPASDVYALGVVLYQFLTGRLPYEGSTLAELAIRRENETPLAPDSYDDSIPETLSAAVLRALESDPQRRYGSARTLASALRMGLAGQDPTVLDSGEALTRSMEEPPTERTRRLPATDYEPAKPTAPRRPPPRRAAPPPPPPAAPAPARPPRRSGLGTFARFLGALLVIAIIAAIVVAIVLLVTEVGQQTDIGLELRETLDDQIQSIQDFIEENTAQ